MNAQKALLMKMADNRQRGVGHQYQIHTNLWHTMGLVFLWTCQTTFLPWPELKILYPPSTENY